jgi:hypothetical protein
MTIHRHALPAEDIECVDGVPATTVPRTLLDLSATTDIRTMRRLIRRAEFADLTTIEELATILARYPRRRGRRTLAGILASHIADAGRTRSELEDRSLISARAGASRRQRSMPYSRSGASESRSTAYGARRGSSSSSTAGRRTRAGRRSRAIAPAIGH